MLIERTLHDIIQSHLRAEPRILVLYGPRQAGKTTLIRQLLSETNLPAAMFNGDDIRTQELFAQPNLDKLRAVVGDHRLLVVDEAQRIENIGLSLKLLYDYQPMHMIVSGSASFELASKMSEPLTGRTTIFTLYPLAYSEIPLTLPITSNSQRLEEFLRFGMYPKVIGLSYDEKESYLYDLVSNYLYRDILTFEQVRKPKKVIDLLTLLALQIGSEVSVSELGAQLALTRPIVEKYLDLLEKMFVIVNLRGFSRNLRKEISKTSKYYFIDLGFRNALIRNFNPLHLRSDAGALFENFAIIERMKRYLHRRQFANFYFWRTYDQREIDLVEEHQGRLRAFEFKLKGGEANSRSAAEFMSTYANSEHTVITPDRLDEFLL